MKYKEIDMKCANCRDCGRMFVYEGTFPDYLCPECRHRQEKEDEERMRELRKEFEEQQKEE